MIAVIAIFCSNFNCLFLDSCSHSPVFAQIANCIHFCVWKLLAARYPICEVVRDLEMGLHKICCLSRLGQILAGALALVAYVVCDWSWDSLQRFILSTDQILLWWWMIFHAFLQVLLSISRIINSAHNIFVNWSPERVRESQPCADWHTSISVANETILNENELNHWTLLNFKMVYRVKHGSVCTDQLPWLWVLEVAFEMLAGMKPTEMKLSPIPWKKSNAHSQPQEWRLCRLPLKSVPLQRSP